MRRYAVALVLAAWAVTVLVGCNWTLLWFVALILAAVWQASAHAESYRHPHRR